MTRLKAEARDGGLNVSWWAPLRQSAVEKELTRGYSVRWCAALTDGAANSASCTSVDVPSGASSYQSYQISGLKSNTAYNVSVKVASRFANENWTSALVVTSASGTCRVASRALLSALSVRPSV